VYLVALAMTRTADGRSTPAEAVRAWVRRTLEPVPGVEHIRLSDTRGDLGIAVFVTAADAGSADRINERLRSRLDSAADRPDGWSRTDP
jgi:hypothetical protein